MVMVLVLVCCQVGPLNINLVEHPGRVIDQVLYHPEAFQRSYFNYRWVCSFIVFQKLSYQGPAGEPLLSIDDTGAGAAGAVVAGVAEEKALIKYSGLHKQVQDSALTIAF